MNDDLTGKLKDSIAAVAAKKSLPDAPAAQLEPIQGTHYPFPGEDAAINPMDLLQIAVNKDADISKLEKLMELQLRWEQNEARKAFVKAMNAFKADPPEIAKNKRVAFGSGERATAYDYATLDEVCRQVTQGLSKHGISHRWQVLQSGDGLIRVSCILTHELGHSEETTLSGSADTSGSKNAIQAIGSAVTYLERYSLLAATGLAAKNGDNDGQGAPQMETLQVHLDRMVGAENLTMLDRAYKDAFKEATRLGNTKAMKAIVDTKDNKKRELEKA
jgi:ERF superfamily